MRNKFLAIMMTVIILAVTGSAVMAAPIHQGRPTAFDSSASAGYYIWQDGDRWNLQMINVGARHVFSGMVETDGTFSGVSAMTSENIERVAMKVGAQKIDFTFNSLAKTDGFSFTISNNQNATFTLLIDGMAVDPSTVYIGQQNRHPASNSFSANNIVYDSAYVGLQNLQGLQGRPTAMNNVNVLGYFIWQEGDRWFLKTITQGSLRQFTGTVRTGGTFADVTRVSLEDNDLVRVNDANNEINFNLKTEGDEDGISFRLNNSQDATFALYMDGQVINPSNIYLGSQNIRPTANPFSLSSRDGQYTINNNRDLSSNNMTNPNETYQTIASSYAQGKPTELNPGEVFGYFIWQDDQNRWFLQTTTTGEERQFTGTIETAGMISDLRQGQSQRPYDAVVDAISNKISFTFKTGGSDRPDKQNELSFMVTDGADLRFRLNVDGQPVDPKKIFLGSANYHPTNSAVKIYSSNQ
jgi:hypothetical protein